jgi:hypothetical protein
MVSNAKILKTLVVISCFTNCYMCTFNTAKKVNKSIGVIRETALAGGTEYMNTSP